MNVQTKEFWIKVKEEYKPDCHFFICFSSETFYQAWGILEKEEQIVNLAELFLKENNIINFVSDTVILFVNFKSTIEEKRQIRIQFIDHMIKKYS